MERDKYVGRVGALAVALGIGSAVVVMSGEAWATSDGARSSGSDSSASSSGPRKTADKPSGSASSKGTAERRSGPSSAEDSTKKRSSRADRSTKTRDTKRAGITEPAAAAEAVQVAYDEDDSTAAAVVESAPRDQEAATAPTGAPATSADASADAVVESAPRAATRATAVTPLSAPQVLAERSDEPATPSTAPPPAVALTPLRRQSERALTASAISAASRSLATRATGDSALNAAPGEAPGGPSGPVVVGADGTRYVVTRTGAVVRVSIIDADGQIVTTSADIPGSTNSYTRAVARPDGTLIVVATNNSRSRSTVSAVDSQGVVTRVATIIGAPDEPVTVGADGALYFRTNLRITPGLLGTVIDYRFVRISPTNSVRSFSYDADLQLKPDGSAYLVSSWLGFNTLRAFDSEGRTRAMVLPYGTDPSAPILGQDGNIYVTAGIRGWFGSKSTRVYTVTDTSRTVRSISGLPGDTVVTADGVFLETFTYSGRTDDGTGTTYVSRITADSIDTSDVIDGRIPGFQVAADGTVYAPVNTSTSEDSPVAVVDPDGNVTTVSLPGSLVWPEAPNVRGGGTHTADDSGYFIYTAEGTQYVAVLTPDGTVARTVELPAGALVGQVFFGPDGAPYVTLEHRDAQGQYTSQQILALSTDTYTPIIEGSRFFTSPTRAPSVRFGPDGVGYLITDGGVQRGIEILGFNAAGEAVSSAGGLTVPVLHYRGVSDTEVLFFSPDGTAYLTVYGPTDAGVYAVTASGAVKVLDLEYGQLRNASIPSFDADGNGFVTLSGSNDGVPVTYVFTFTPV